MPRNDRVIEVESLDASNFYHSEAIDKFLST